MATKPEKPARRRRRSLSVLRVPLSRAALAKFPDQERGFFLLAGHAVNELNTLKHLLRRSLNRSDPTDLAGHVQLARLLMFLRLLSGKLHESWEMIRRQYQGAKLSRVYDELLDENGRAALQALRRYFKRKDSPLEIIRNKFAFHFDIASVNQDLALVPDSEDWSLYMLERETNSLHHLCDRAAFASLRAQLSTADGSDGFQDFVVELFSLTVDMTGFLQHFMIAALERHVGPWTGLGLEKLTARNVVSDWDVQLPAFTVSE